MVKQKRTKFVPMVAECGRENTGRDYLCGGEGGIISVEGIDI